MENVLDHKHNGTDSRKLKASEALLGTPQASVSEVTGTAGGTYGATEQTIINDLVASHNDLLTKLQSIGLIL